MSDIPYIQHSELMTGEGHHTLPDTLNRALRSVLTASGVDPDADFAGFVPKSSATVYASVYTGTFSDKINAAIAALPSNGGTVDATDLTGAQYMSADIAITKPSVFLKLGNAVIYMGTYRLTAASTAAGLRIEGITPYAFNQAIGSSGGTFLYYEGASCPVDIGDSSGSSPFYGLKLANFAIYTAGTTNTPNTVGLWLRKILFGTVSELYINVGVSSYNQTCLRVDGTGFFCANVRLQNLALVGAGCGFHFTGGSGFDAANACIVDGANYAGDGVHSIGVLIDADCNGNRFDNMDIEGCLVGLKCTGTSSGNLFEGRVETNTTDVYFDTGSHHNWFKASHGPVALTTTDLNGTNTIIGPTKFLFGSLIQSTGMILTPGTAPVSPAEGQMWATSTDAYIRLNGADKKLTP